MLSIETIQIIYFDYNLFNDDVLIRNILMFKYIIKHLHLCLPWCLSFWPDSSKIKPTKIIMNLKDWYVKKMQCVINKNNAKQF